MALLQNYTLANNVNTTLAGTVSAIQTTITLASSANLPTLSGGNYFPLTLNDAATQSVFEIVYVTAISGANLTVIRAQENTTAQVWNVGDYAFSTITANVLNTYFGSIIPAMTSAGAFYGIGQERMILDATTAVGASTTITFAGKAIFTNGGSGFVVDCTAGTFTTAFFGITTGFTFTSVNGHTYAWVIFGN